MNSVRPAHVLLATAELLCAFVLSGCASSTLAAPAPLTTECAGIRVIVSFDVLGADTIDACAGAASGEITVADALAEVGITTEGTAAYGDAVVCRVNGLPAADAPFTVTGHEAYTESCENMPPEFAYWALWLKTPTGSWDYATEGVSTQLVHPGDSIGLMFSSGGQTPQPG